MRVKIKHGWERFCSSLDSENSHLVISVKGDWYRLMNVAGEPILLPARAFVVTDPSLPADWMVSVIDGETDATPPALAEPPYFMELFHDGDTSVRKRLHAYLRAVYADQAAAVPLRNTYVHLVPREPSEHSSSAFYLELDGERGEVRRVEVLPSGVWAFADAHDSEGTSLASPDQTDLVHFDQSLWIIEEIDASAFEEAWSHALGTVYD